MVDDASGDDDGAVELDGDLVFVFSCRYVDREDPLGLVARAQREASVLLRRYPLELEAAFAVGVGEMVRLAAPVDTDDCTREGLACCGGRLGP